MQNINKKLIIQIIIIYLLWNVFSIFNYSSIYQLIDNLLHDNFIMTYLLTYNNFCNLMNLLIVGIGGCYFIFRHKTIINKLKYFNKKNIFLMICHIIFFIIITWAGAIIGTYKINLSAVLSVCLSEYIFIAFSEEFIFRGFILDNFLTLAKNGKQEIYLIILSSVMFSLMHLPNYIKWTENITLGGILYRLLIPLLIGFLLGFIFWKEENLIICILLHGSYNLISDLTFNNWQYICYGIYWLFLISYVLYLFKSRHS